MVSRYQKVVIKRKITKPHWKPIEERKIVFNVGDIAIREIRGTSSGTFMKTMTVKEAIKEINWSLNSEYTSYDVKLTAKEIVQKLLDDDTLIAKFFWSNKKDNVIFVRKVDSQEVFVEAI